MEARRANGSRLGEMGERIHRRGEVQKKNSQLTRRPVIRIRRDGHQLAEGDCQNSSGMARVFDVVV